MVESIIETNTLSQSHLNAVDDSICGVLESGCCVTLAVVQSITVTITNNNQKQQFAIFRRGVKRVNSVTCLLGVCGRGRQPLTTNGVCCNSSPTEVMRSSVVESTKPE